MVWTAALDRVRLVVELVHWTLNESVSHGLKTYVPEERRIVRGFRYESQARAYVLDQGAVVHQASARDLLADAEIA
jgi:hypothetical protein